jgi:hypothetical protein
MKTVMTAVLGLAVAASVAAASPEGRERFSAFAVDLDGATFGGRTSTVQVTVDRWSTPEDRRALEVLFQEKGPEALLAAMQKMKPIGRIHTPGTIGYDLRFAYQTPVANGGRRIIVGTDRPLSFYEASQRPRSADYPFTILDFRVDARGRGQGSMVVASRVLSMGETIEIENYGTTAVKLMQVRLDR